MTSDAFQGKCVPVNFSQGCFLTTLKNQPTLATPAGQLSRGKTEAYGLSGISDLVPNKSELFWQEMGGSPLFFFFSSQYRGTENSKVTHFY